MIDPTKALADAAREVLKDAHPSDHDCFHVCNYVVYDLRDALATYDAAQAHPAPTDAEIQSVVDELCEASMRLGRCWDDDMERAGQEQAQRADETARDMLMWRRRAEVAEATLATVPGDDAVSAIRDGDYWTRQMEHTCEELVTGDLAGQLPIDVIDGNRAVCETLRKLTHIVRCYVRAAKEPHIDLAAYDAAQATREEREQRALVEIEAAVDEYVSEVMALDSRHTTGRERLLSLIARKCGGAS